MEDRCLNRRQVLKTAVMAVGALGVSKILLASGTTPAQTEGPFYPKRPSLDRDNDLTQIAGSTQSAIGKSIIVSGRILTEIGEPLSGAGVEIWQACASGRYNDPQDTNPAKLDPNFQYWGRDFSDAKGNYTFKTIVPGSYPATADWSRPPHIHFKIYKLGFHELTTQMYFEGEALNEADKILKNLSQEEQQRVIIPLKQIAGDVLRTANFDITLPKVV